MIWIVDKFRINQELAEKSHDLEVPIQIEIEYRVAGKRVDSSSISKRVRYNRPLLIKEARSWSTKDLDELIDQAVEKAILQHFATEGFMVDSE